MSENATMPSDIEQLSPHMTREWLLNRQIVVYKNTSLTRQDIDFSIQSMLDTMGNWGKDRPYLAIIDGSHNKAVLTPYARDRLEAAALAFPEVTGRTAVIIQRTAIGHVLRLFVLTQRQQGARMKRIFFTRDDAITWLKELL